MEPTNLYIIVSATFVIAIGYDIYSWSRTRMLSLPEMRIKRLQETLNFSFIAIGTISLLASIAFHINIFNYARPIEYSNHGVISLKDFKGFKRPNQTLDGGKEFAFTTTSIEWEKKRDEIKIMALFHPSRSYVYNENIVDRLLLQHELYHFHITEYFARQTRKSIEELPIAPSEAMIKTTLKTYSLLEETMQLEYDEQTYHGYILKEQKRWQQKVDSLLISHQNYSNTTIRH